MRPRSKRLPVAAAAQASVAAVAVRAAVAATDNFSTDEFTSGGATSVLEPAPVAEPAAKKKPAAAQPRRAGSRKPLLAVLGAVVLCVAALTLPRSLGIDIPFLSDLQIPSLSEMGIEIPFIGDIFKSEPEDSAGGLKLALVAGRHRGGVHRQFIRRNALCGQGTGAEQLQPPPQRHAGHRQALHGGQYRGQDGHGLRGQRAVEPGAVLPGPDRHQRALEEQQPAPAT